MNQIEEASLIEAIRVERRWFWVNVACVALNAFSVGYNVLNALLHPDLMWPLFTIILLCCIAAGMSWYLARERLIGWRRLWLLYTAAR